MPNNNALLLQGIVVYRVARVPVDGLHLMKSSYKKIVEFLAYIVPGIAAVAIISHFWISERLGVLRLLYPLEAVVTQPTISCSAGAPLWMQDVLAYSLWDNESPAGQLAYIAPDASLYSCQYGWQGSPLFSSLVSDRSRFRYASMTKLLTADAVLRRINSGDLALKKRLLDVFPEISELHDSRLGYVTVENLLMHTAGFDRMSSPDPMAMRGKKPWCPYNLTTLSKVQLDFDPGSRYAYSNLGYCLLGSILERSSGKDFRTILEDEYRLKERGIKFVDGASLSDEVAYDFRNSDVYGASYSRDFDFFALSSSAGLSGSAKALAKLLKELGRSGHIMAAQPDISKNCDLAVLRSCYGYAVFPYQQLNASLLTYIQPGFLYAGPSLAIFDGRGGVTVWIGNGMLREGSSTDKITEFIYRKLVSYYKAFDLQVGKR